jgi:predicted nucleotidyltransferase component of viral defense system
MIPLDYITEWRARAPWVQDFQVEQDLVISRALVEIFSHPVLAEGLAFRGGTALYKLYLKPARYSEDIDLVQLRAEASGPIMDALREVLDPWLSKPQWKQTKDRFAFVYRFDSEDTPPMRLRLKVEINSREHFSIFGFNRLPFSVDSRWFGGASDIVTYELDELLATKLRALYQRKKGRDLFDLATTLGDSAVDPDRVAAAFIKYMARSGHPVTRALFERNLADKLCDPQFSADIGPLLAGGHHWDLTEVTRTVSERLIALLPGAPWKGEEQARLRSPRSRPP